MTGLPGAGQQLAGHRLLRLLGEGAQSQVWLAGRLGAPGLVALKVGVLGRPPSAAARRGFLAAAQAAQRLSHPHIVKVFEAGIEGDVAWLSMEAAPGGDLVRYTRRPRLLPPIVVLRIGERIALALDHAHQRGVVHRDVKPANVIVDWAGDTLKLVDFGLARTGGGSHTGTGVVPGTPVYMAPEVLAGVPASAASDLYALGAMLFELLSGAPPFEEPSLGRFLQRVAQERAPALSTRQPDLVACDPLLDALLAKSAAERPQRAGAVAQALRRLADTLPGRAADPGPMSH